MYMSSIHTANEGAEARGAATNYIAHDFLKELASGFGVPPPSSGASAVGTSVDGMSRRGTVQPYSPSPGEFSKHNSEYVKRRTLI